LSCVVVYCREPVVGQVKTRLAETVGAGIAARVYAAMLAHTVRVAVSAGFPVTLSLSSAPERAWADGFGLPWEQQIEGGLGDRMADSFRLRFAEGYRRVVLIGSDCPLINPDHLAAAFDRLRNRAVVIGPAADGGYWLVGQQAPGVDLFTGIPWSKPSTMERTRERLREQSVEWEELELLRDVDTGDDLQLAMASPGLEEGLASSLRAAVGDGG
jgi:rSAM/selenodomain-associated transferase 1